MAAFVAADVGATPTGRVLGTMSTTVQTPLESRVESAAPVPQQ